MTMSRTLRMASALWRWAGQTTIDSDPGINTAVCAIPHAATVVLPTCRAAKARIDAPRFARRNCFCHSCREIPSTNLTHRTGSSRQAISRSMFIAVDLLITILQQSLRDLRLELGLIIELLNEPFSDLHCANVDIGLIGHVQLLHGGLEGAA